LGKVGRVFTLDILTVNGNAATVYMDSMEPDVMPGDTITVREQPDTVAGAVVLRRSSVPIGKRPLSHGAPALYENRLIAMFHSSTPKHNKDVVLKKHDRRGSMAPCE
jgi:hypothetical protein